MAQPSHFLFLESNLRSMVRQFLAGLFLASALLAQEPSPENLLRHAMELQQAGDLEGAVRSYREFLALRPKEFAVQANLGCCWLISAGTIKPK